MITNLISFLYNIKVEIVRKKGSSYLFLFEDNFYIFKKCFVSDEYLAYIYNFIKDRNVLFHNIVKNRHNKYVSTYNNENYVLMMVKFNINRLLLIEDIENACRYHVSYVKKNDFSWINLWKNKIDQVEYFVANSKAKMDIYTITIINYYLGLAELAILLFDKVQVDYLPLSLCHNRIVPNCDLYDYYSVTELTIDHMTRDIGEYVKNYIYSEDILDIERFFSLTNLDLNNKYMILSRVLFPSYFFDLFDDYVINNKDFSYFYKHFVNMELYENNLKKFISMLLSGNKKEF